MKTLSKLSSEARRSAIIKAVRHVFAENGFHGTTTRALAQAAGVSEALLFKHFPNKEALFSAMLTACCTEQEVDRFERLKKLEPGAATLVLMVHTLVDFFLGRTANDELAIQDRLMLRSLAEDGEFARHVYGRVAENWLPGIVACIDAAVAAGEAERAPVQADLAGWFTHTLPYMVHLLQLPANPAINFRVRRKALLEQCVWFLLRGMGLKTSSIKRHYGKSVQAHLAEPDHSN
jgi:AcrR family transcriptional regulator